MFQTKASVYLSDEIQQFGSSWWLHLRSDICWPWVNSNVMSMVCFRV